MVLCIALYPVWGTECISYEAAGVLLAEQYITMAIMARNKGQSKGNDQSKLTLVWPKNEYCLSKI